MPRPGNAGWAGTSDGVAARGFVNGRGLPRSGGRESTAGAHRSEVPARRQTRTRERLSARRQTWPRKHGPCPQADSDAGTPPSVLRVAIFAESVENDYISVENDYIWKQL